MARKAAVETKSLAKGDAELNAVLSEAYAKRPMTRGIQRRLVFDIKKMAAGLKKKRLNYFCICEHPPWPHDDKDAMNF